jgi:hypothetical protein
MGTVEITTRPSLQVKAITRLEVGLKGAIVAFAALSMEWSRPVGEKTIGGTSSYFFCSCIVPLPETDCQGGVPPPKPEEAVISLAVFSLDHDEEDDEDSHIAGADFNRTDVMLLMNKPHTNELNFGLSILDF